MAVHRLLLRFVEEFPELRDMATKKIQAFIADEKNRHKDVVPALGEFICLLMISHIGWDELKGVCGFPHSHLSLLVFFPVTVTSRHMILENIEC